MKIVKFKNFDLTRIQNLKTLGKTELIKVLLNENKILGYCI